MATTFEITGSEGASFSGYYLVRGNKVPVSGTIPKTVTDFEVTGCEFRKDNPQDTLWVKASNGSSILNLASTPGSVGVAMYLSGGWRGRLIRK